MNDIDISMSSLVMIRKIMEMHQGLDFLSMGMQTKFFTRLSLETLNVKYS